VIACPSSLHVEGKAEVLKTVQTHHAASSNS